MEKKIGKYPGSPSRDVIYSVRVGIYNTASPIIRSQIAVEDMVQDRVTICRAKENARMSRICKLAKVILLRFVSWFFRCTRRITGQNVIASKTLVGTNE